MLQLHEEILSEATATTKIYKAQNRAKDGTEERIKHDRWHSIETLEGVIGERATNAVRRSLDVSWLGRSKLRTSSTAPGEAANIAKVFERMVRIP